MKLKIDFEIPESSWKIEPKSQIMSFGSCFSDEIGQLLKDDGFKIRINPFGVIFHPVAIAQILQKIIQNNSNTEVVQSHDVFFSWDTSGTFFDYHQEELLRQFSNEIINLNKELKETDILIVTFGTSYGYRLNKTNQLVANCHKYPKENFTKELTDLEEMKLIWRKLINALKEFNPKLKLLFTVSPVKHLKDGISENTRSKARLIELVHELNGDYFPSFEIIQEELRDYRFYKEDGAHPSKQAVNYVYQRFEEVYFSKEAQFFSQEVRKYQQMKNHRLLYEDSDLSDKFNLKKRQEYERLQSCFPFINIEP